MRDWSISVDDMESFLEAREDTVICEVAGHKYRKSDFVSVDVMREEKIWLRLRRNLDDKFMVCPCKMVDQRLFEALFGDKDFYDTAMDTLWWNLFCDEATPENPAWYFLGEQTGALYKVEADSDIVRLCNLDETKIALDDYQKAFETDEIDGEVGQDGTCNCQSISCSNYYTRRIDAPDQLAEVAFIDNNEEVQALLKTVLTEDVFEMLKIYYPR